MTLFTDTQLKTSTKHLVIINSYLYTRYFTLLHYKLTELHPQIFEFLLRVENLDVNVRGISGCMILRKNIF